jgi:hypothetical protein
VLPRLLEVLIENVSELKRAQPDMYPSLYISYLEVYQEQIFDLLNPVLVDGCRSKLDIKEEKNISVVKGLSEWEAASLPECKQMIREGQNNRTTFSTNSNEESSRSHSVFTITYRRRVGLETKENVLKVIDLAGAERCSKTGVAGQRLKEGLKINSSLLALKMCLEALRKNQLNVHRAPEIVPFRQSKLTRLLQQCFTSSFGIHMVVNFNPEPADLEQNIDALRFGSKAKDIKCLSRVGSFRGPRPSAMAAAHQQQLDEALSENAKLSVEVERLARALTDTREKMAIMEREFQQELEEKLEECESETRVEVMDEIQEELLAELEQRHTRHLAQIKADHDELLQRKIEVLCNEFASHDTAQAILAKVAHVHDDQGEPKPTGEALVRRLSVGMRAHAAQIVESEYLAKISALDLARIEAMDRVDCANKKMAELERRLERMVRRSECVVPPGSGRSDRSCRASASADKLATLQSARKLHECQYELDVSRTKSLEQTEELDELKDQLEAMDHRVAELQSSVALSAAALEETQRREAAYVDEIRALEARHATAMADMHVQLAQSHASQLGDEPGAVNESVLSLQRQSSVFEQAQLCHEQAVSRWKDLYDEACAAREVAEGKLADAQGELVQLRGVAREQEAQIKALHAEYTHSQPTHRRTHTHTHAHAHAHTHTRAHTHTGRSIALIGQSLSWRN